MDGGYSSAIVVIVLREIGGDQVGGGSVDGAAEGFDLAGL
jgi:hypothetical protein